jgi:hypothetical protein
MLLVSGFSLLVREKNKQPETSNEQPATGNEYRETSKQ